MTRAEASPSRRPPASFARRRAAAAVVLCLACACACGAWDGMPGTIPAVDAFDPTAESGVGRDGGATGSAMNATVWGFAGLSNGQLLVGADQVQEFDGQDWRTISIPGADAVRGLAAAGDRVYVGAVGDMGYITRAAGGRWRYTSLRADLKASGIEAPQEIWDVAATAGGVCFVAAQEVIRLNSGGGRAGEKIQSWKLPCAPRLVPMRTTSREGTDELWLYQDGSGLLRMEEKGPIMAYPDSALPESPVVWVLTAGPAVGRAPDRRPGPQQDGPVLIGTSSAVYSRTGGRWARLPNLSAAVAGKLPVCAAWLSSGDTFAIGTYAGGVIVCSLNKGEDRVLANVDRAHGLPDDHVQALWRDGSDGLWVGMTSQVARIPAGGRVAVFDERNGLGETPVAGVVAASGETVVVSSTGGYAERSGSLGRLPGLGSRVYGVAGATDSAWAFGFGGIWRLRLPPAGSGASPPPAQAWERVYAVSNGVHGMDPLDERHLLFVEPNALKELSLTERGDWAAHDLVADLDAQPTGIMSDGGGDVWVSTRTNGALRFAWSIRGDDPEMRRLHLKAHYYPGHGMPEDAGSVSLTQAGGKVFAFAAGGILALNAAGTGFETEPALDGFVGVAAAGAGYPAYWVVRRRELPAMAVIAVHREGAEGAERWEPLAVSGLEKVGQVTGASLTHLPEILWIGGTKGLLRVDLSGPPGPPPPLPAVNLVPEPDAKSHRFRFSSPAALSDPAIFFQTRLVGADDAWSGPARTSKSGFPALSSGRYRFDVRAMDRWGRAGPVSSQGFVVPVPWYLAWPAFAGYGAALVLVAAGVSRLRMVRLRRRNAALDALVTERTRELAARTRELDERSRELEMANTAKTEFLEVISHEIRNPLNGLRGLVAMLDETPLADPQRELAASVSACAGALSRTFDEVLNFAKLEAGQAPLRQQAFDLRGLVEEVVALHRLAARQAGCGLEVQWRMADDGNGAEGGTFMGDAEKIRTILNNLVGNAVKYAPGAPIEIAAEVDPGAGDGEAVDVTVEVRDHGPGIPAEEQALIFNKFVRGSHAKTRRVPGTGLGLATCRALAEQMGGFIGLESPSKSRETAKSVPGATFFLQVRLRVAPKGGKPAARPVSDTLGKPAGRARPEEPGRSASAGPPAIYGAAAARPRVLIVEDQEYNQRVAIRIALRLGFEPDVASDGKEALQKLELEPFDALFLDWEMPGIKGDEIARRVRARGSAHPPIIIATTGHDSEAIKSACLEGGMDAFVVKPYDEGTLRAALRSALETRDNTGLRALVESQCGPAPGRAASPPATERAGVQPDSSPLSFNVFALVGDGDPGQTAQAAEDYLSSLDEEMAAIGAAIDRREWAEAGRRAHRLRSHAGLVRAQGLRAAAAAFQREIENADEPRRDALWRQLSGEADAVKRGIESAQA